MAIKLDTVEVPDMEKSPLGGTGPPMGGGRSRSRWWDRGREAEHEKLMSHIEVLRCRARRVTDGRERARPVPALVDLLHEALDEDGWRAGGEAAHRYADALEEFLPSLASAEYLRVSMQYELSRPRTEPVHVVDILGLGQCEVPFRRTELVVDTVDCTEYFAETLSRLYRARADQMRHDRLMSNLRRSYLPQVAVVIVGALAVTALAILSGEADAAHLGTWNEMLLAAALGALGGALASALKLRDIAELNPFRSVVTFLLMQPLVGAAFGLVSWVVLASGVVEFGTSDMNWAMSGVVAFLAGYSEPFLLGILAKPMGLAQ